MSALSLLFDFSPSGVAMSDHAAFCGLFSLALPLLNARRVRYRNSTALARGALLIEGQHSDCVLERRPGETMGRSGAEQVSGSKGLEEAARHFLSSLQKRAVQRL